jgi:hypothetical protein
MVAGMVQGRPSAVSDPFHGAAKDRARARLRQPGDGYRQLEGSDRADLLANEADTARSQRRAGSRPPLIR